MRLSSEYRLLTRTLIMILFILSYFLIIRPFRSEVNKAVYVSTIEKHLQEKDYILTNSVSQIIYFGDDEFGAKAQLKVPFGLFFLVPVVGLILIGAGIDQYILLFVIHLLGGILSYSALWIGILMTDQVFILIDIITKYLVPVLSIMTVVLALSDNNKSKFEIIRHR